MYSRIPSLLPQDPTLANYGKVFEAVPVWQCIANSLVVAFLCVVGNVVGTTLAGFALAKLRFKGRNIVLALVAGTLILPAESVIISQFLVIKSLGLADSLLGVAPPMTTVHNVLLMFNAFRMTPKEIDEAALMDGANAWQRFIRVGLPAVKGTIAIVVIFAFIGAWDDFLWPLIVLTGSSHFTLTVGVEYLKGSFSSDQRAIAAGSMIAFIPIAVFFALVQRWFIRGVGEGAVKG